MSFPNTIEEFNNPQATDPRLGHAALHSSVNDLLKAIQTRIGLDGSVIPSTLIYQINQKQNSSEKGQAGGYASLDGSAKVPMIQLPTVVGLGDMISAQNLSDVADVETARDNLSVYSKLEIDTELGDINDELGLKELLSNKSLDVSTDGSSDLKYPSVKAVKDYVDFVAAGLLDFRGTHNPSGNAYPSTGGSGVGGAIMKGDTWIMSVNGTLTAVPIQAGDWIIALVDSPGVTATNWGRANTNITYTPEDTANKKTTMTGNTTSDTFFLTAKAIYDWCTSFFVPKTGGTFTGDIIVPTEAYGAGWNGSNEVPTKDALYDKIETIGLGSVGTTQTIFVAGENITAGNALYILPADGKAYKTDASNASKVNFTGFATNTVSIGGDVIVDTGGVSATQSGLTINSTYYLKDKYIYSTGSEFTNQPYSTSNVQSGNRMYMQKFVADFRMIDNVKVNIAKKFSASGSSNVNCSIYNVSGGVPTTLVKSGPTVSVAYDADSNYTEYTFTFSYVVGDTEMTIGNTYALVFDPGTDAEQLGISYPATLTTTYLAGYKYNAAASWTTIANDYAVNITGKDYTGPFDGLISTTAGTNSKKVGKGVKSTAILIVQPPL